MYYLMKIVVVIMINLEKKVLKICLICQILTHLMFFLNLVVWVEQELVLLLKLLLVEPLLKHMHLLLKVLLKLKEQENYSLVKEQLVDNLELINPK